MQQIKKLNLPFQLFGKWSRATLLFKQQNVRSVEWDSLDSQRHKFVEHLQKLLPLSYEQGIKILEEVSALQSNDQMMLMKPNIDLLLAKNVKAESIIENPFLLLMKRDIIEHKLEIIQTMCPKDINDFVPLLVLKLAALKRIARLAKAEINMVPEENRIYYFSRNLNVDPNIVTKHFVKNEFIFTAAFSGLQKKLRILQDYNVSSLNILQSLYVFACSDQLLIKRLERIRSMGIVDIRLWTIKCTEENFEEYFKSIWKFSRGTTNSMPYRSLREIIKKKKTQFTETIVSANAPPTIYAEKSKVIAIIHDMLLCDGEEAAAIYYNHLSYFDQLHLAKANISFLIENKIDNRSILDNPFLLTMDIDEIKDKLEIVEEMQPKIVTDFVPLLVLDVNELTKIRDAWKRETTLIEYKHRIYFFSEKLQIDASVVSEAFAKNYRIFFWSFDLLLQKLETLLSYNIPGMEILGCLEIFGRSVETISNKLKLLSVNKGEQISPWMVCCDLDRFNRLVEQRNEKKEILEDCEGAEQYLTKRLNWSEKQLTKYKIAYPVLFKTSVLKLNEHIDYLLNETSYTIDDINGHIFIFQCNLLEVKCRIKDMSMLNYTPKLYIIASSRNTYLKKIKKICRDVENGMEKYKLIERRVREQKLSKNK